MREEETVAERICKYCKTIIINDSKICPNCGKEKKLTLRTKVGLVILGLIAISTAMNSSKTSSTPTSTIKMNAGNNSFTPVSTPLTQSISPVQEALSSAKLQFTWRKAAFDNVMEANFTIENPSKYDIKDIQIKCTLFAKSGTAIDSNSRIIYDIVKSKGKKKISRFNMGFINTQANSSTCEITDLKIN